MIDAPAASQVRTIAIEWIYKVNVYMRNYLRRVNSLYPSICSSIQFVWTMLKEGPPSLIEERPPSRLQYGTPDDYSNRIVVNAMHIPQNCD